MTIEERLNEQLNQKDSKIEELQAKIMELENTVRGIKTGWMRHEKLPEKQSLPVPRLEIIWTVDDGDLIATYQLVYRHLLDYCVAVPLGVTSCRGSGKDKPFFGDGKLDLPFRDGVHIRSDAKNLRLPAFVIFEKTIQPVLPKEEK